MLSIVLKAYKRSLQPHKLDNAHLMNRLKLIEKSDYVRPTFKQNNK